MHAESAFKDHVQSDSFTLNSRLQCYRARGNNTEKKIHDY